MNPPTSIPLVDHGPSVPMRNIAWIQDKIAFLRLESMDAFKARMKQRNFVQLYDSHRTYLRLHDDFVNSHDWRERSTMEQRIRHIRRLLFSEYMEHYDVLECSMSAVSAFYREVAYLSQYKTIPNDTNL